MKTELTIISDDLNHGIIDEKEARTLLLGLLSVSGSALSPIEWLQKEVYNRFGGETFLKVFANEFEKAKQMEKDLLNAR